MGSQELFAGLGWIKPLAILAAAAVFLWRPLIIKSRRSIVAMAVAWVAISTYEFWILGSHSFAALGAEVEYSMPGLIFLNRASSSAKFLFGLSGGIDSYGFATFSGQYISLERALLNLPLGVANFFHKGLLVSVALAGMYRLARSFKGVERGSAFAAAALFSLSHERLLLMTWSHGLGFALVPLGAYLVVRRSHKKAYFIAVTGLAALNTISCTPTHSFLAMLAGIFAIALVADKKNDLRFMRISAAIAILIVAILANWHEGLYAKSLIGPLTARGTENPSLWPIINPVFGAIFLVGIFQLWQAGAQRVAAQFFMAALAILFGGSALYIAADSIPGLGAIKAINFQNASIAFFTLAPLTAVCAFQAAKEDHLLARGAKAIFSGLFVGQLAWLKVYIPIVWLSQGGLTVLSGGIAQLQNNAWVSAEPTRVISIPYRLPSNVAAAAGLDTLDGFYPLIDRRMEIFWNGILAPKHVDTISGSLSLDDAAIDYKCCASYELGQYANLDLLRIANVGYVLSILPLSDTRLRQISAAQEDLPPRSADRLAERLKKYISLIFNMPSIRVYALESPLPRLYAARALRVLPKATTDDDQLREIQNSALGKEAIVLESDKPADANIQEPVEIHHWHSETDVVRASISAQTAGVVVLNIAHSPFWKAYVDGKQVALFPVNIVQMAIAVPAGAQEIVFRYERPLLREKVARLLH